MFHVFCFFVFLTVSRWGGGRYVPARKQNPEQPLAAPDSACVPNETAEDIVW